MFLWHLLLALLIVLLQLQTQDALSCPEGMRNLQGKKYFRKNLQPLGNFTITDHDILTPQHVVTTIAYHSLSDSVFIGGLDTESLYPFIINYKTTQKMCVIVTSIYININTF